ncbi:MAG: TetR/AcrR family transcriptional regulator [Silvibacterium sp.]|nr:TetR/AcrR family transcriptional regulator [Silvibacterium sp.]
MSGKAAHNPQEQTPATQKHRKLDARTRRTRTLLGDAFLRLIMEKPIEDITVQEVLDRAGVGRSTFYLHFRDKNDLLLSQLERFLEHMSSVLMVNKEKSLRVAPVTEMFDHLNEQRKLYCILRDAGRLNDFFDLAQDYFARGIEQRLIDSGRLSKLSKPELAARANALAGSLLSLLRWWMDRVDKEPAVKMDEMFHRMVWNGLR